MGDWVRVGLTVAGVVCGLGQPGQTPGPVSTRPATTQQEKVQEAARPPFVEDMLFVPVTVGGVDAGMWLIDTGAATSVVGTASAAAGKMLGLPVQAEAPSGRAAVRMGVVPEVAFLDRRLSQLPVIELDLRPAAALMRMPFDGVLGVNALGKVYRLDFPNRRFVEGPFPEGTEAMTFEWADGSDRPSVVGTIDGKPVRLTLDSGKNRVLNINRAWLVKNGVVFEEIQGGVGFDAAGLGRQARTVVSSLEVLGRKVSGVTAILGERPSGATDGLIGVGLLRDAEIEINVERRTVRVRWVR